METAIWARGVCKSYGGKKGKPVLQNLDITVKKGTIYGLLGPSGCGKTTLLNAIVGCKQIDSGQIRVLGALPDCGSTSFVKKLGFMPQEIALVAEFSVRGAIDHFGWIHGMSNEQIDERFTFLHTLLDLPPSTSLIKDLSGGQQRRVSLAAVLVHNPDVLILDEPTVGLDPVLRHNIWNHLTYLANQQMKTIIITTHYVEEARQAHSIGLMRNGQILSEGPPEMLINKYNCSNVEEVFWLLSRKQEDGEMGTAASVVPVLRAQVDREDRATHADYFEDQQPLQDNNSVWSSAKRCILFTSSHHSKALVTKNLQKFFKNKGTVIFCYLFPLVQMSLLFVSVGKDPRTLRLGVVNPEITPYRSCEEYARSVPTLGGNRDADSDTRTCNYTGLPCTFLMGLRDDQIHQIYFKNGSEAKRGVETGKITAYVEFHPNFTMQTGRMRDDLYMRAEDLDQVQINVHMDKSSYPIAKYVERTLLERYSEYSQQIEGQCGFNKRAAAMPILKLPAVYSSYDAQFLEFLAPGCMLTVSIFLAVSVSALSIVTERTEGTWNRTLIAGVSTTEIVVFHFVTMALVNALQNIVLFIVTFWIYDMECRGSLGTVMLLLTCQGIIGTAFGTLISVLARTVTDCIIMSLGMFYPLMVLSGVCWPLEGMHPALRFFSYYFIPTTMSVEAMSNIINRGWGLLNLHVAKGFISSFGWCILFNGLNIVILKKKQRWD